VKSKSELAVNFSERVGVPIGENYFSDFVDVINGLINGEGSYFIFKLDGGRVGSRLTFVFCDRARDIILRRDASSIEDGIIHIFAGLEEVGGYA